MKSQTVNFPLLVLSSLATILMYNSPQVSSEKILVASFFGAKSHKNVFDPLYNELARRGHQLTIIHPVKSGYTEKNIKEINGVTMDQMMEKEVALMTTKLSIFDLRLSGLRPRTPISPVIVPVIERSCRAYFEMPEVKAILKQKFALVIVGSHMTECVYGLAHKLNTSYILVHPHAIENYKSIFTGFRVPSSFVPSYTTGGSTDEMGFLERTMNFVAYEATTLLYEWYYIPKMEAIYREYLGQDVPSIREIERNASLVLNNAHFSISYPRPQMPQIMDIAGMHCRPGQPLPKDLQDFVDSSGSEGFIIFTLGSHVKASEMPESMKSAFIQAFSKIKQKVLWKWDGGAIEGLSKNVKLVEWLPQQDLLAHPKIRMFITHGGLLSTEEAIFHGVPLIGVPIFGDQISHDSNMRQAEGRGYAITLEVKGLTSDHVSSAINKILSDLSYDKTMKSLGKIFRDRNPDALQKAVYWTEYVMRHNGAVHLRSPATKLNCFQYYNLDVIALLTLILFLIIYLPFQLCKLLFCRSPFSTKEGGSRKAKHNNKASSSKKSN